MFNRLGRAMLRPLYDHSHGRSSALNGDSELALKWWLEILSLRLVQNRPWSHAARDTVYLFADARGSPPRVAAVLRTAQGVVYTDWEPSAQCISAFYRREDSQIMGLEILSVALGLCAFGELLRGKHVMVFSDNTGAEAAIKSGSAARFDHCCLAHSIWKKVITSPPPPFSL